IPLDPDWPIARLQALLRDCGAPLVIAEQGIAEQLSGDWRCIRLDAASAELARCEPLPAAERHPGDLAYVIYTSGSTGEPKAAEITDGNLLNLIDWHCRAFDIGPSDRASHLSGL